MTGFVENAQFRITRILSSRSGRITIAVLLGLAAGMLRYALALTKEPWEDEFWTMEIVRQPLAQIWNFHLMPWERNGPLYHLALAARRAIGSAPLDLREELISLRWFSIECAALTAALPVLLLGRSRHISGLMIGSLLFCLSPFAVLYGMEARMYAWASLLALGSTLMLARFAEGERPPGLIAWIAYTALLTASLFSLYFAAALIPAHLIGGQIFLRTRARAIHGTIVISVCLLLFLWFATLGHAHLFSSGAIAPRAMGPQIDILLKGPFEIAKALALGPSFAGSYRVSDRLVMLMILPASAFFLFRAFRRFDALPVLLALSGASYAIGLWILCGLGILPFWYSYHHAPVAPFFTLLLGIGLSQLPVRRSAAFFAVLFFVYAWGDLRLLRGTGGWNTDWPEAAAAIRQRLPEQESKTEIWLASWTYKPDLEYHLSERSIHTYPYAYDFAEIARSGPHVDRPDPENSPLPTTPKAVVVSFRPPASFGAWIERVNAVYGPPREKFFTGAIELSFYETGPLR